MIKDQTLHMIGNAHIDPVWLWRWPEGLQEIKATFRSALDRMQETADFLFVASSAAFYEWIQQNDPTMFGEIQARVKEGRWEVVGGWWVEPDCNLPCGESFVRQALYGQTWFRRHLGVTARVGFNPDSFGHHAMLPQLLKKSGLDAYCFMRPGPKEKNLPSGLFCWQSPDGSQVVAYRIPHTYSAGRFDLVPHVHSCMGAANGDIMIFYGVGNHGGGPTQANLRSIQEMNESPEFPTLVLSTPQRYFETIVDMAQLPVVSDELQHHARGCYSAHSGIKRWNRQAEQALLSAERWSVIAQRVAEAVYPHEDYTQAWKTVLFNQFHDILAGTALEQAYEDARNSYGGALSLAHRGLNQALQALSWKVAIEYEDHTVPLVVFNPHSWASSVPLEVDWSPLSATDRLVDDAGTTVPHQSLDLGAVPGRSRLAFVADLPPLGYRVYRLRQDYQTAPILSHRASLENDWLRVSVDTDTGCIGSIYDKLREFELLAAPMEAVVYRDRSDTWSHGIDRFDDVVGRFDGHRLTCIESGPVVTIFRSESRYEASTLIQDICVYDRLPWIEVRVTVDWQERHQLLKLRIPTTLEGARVTCEIPHGHTLRTASGTEEPGQTWLDLSAGPHGLALLQDGKPSYDVLGASIGLTILRSPLYAHHEPFEPLPDGIYRYIDQGEQQFVYRLVPHGGNWQSAYIAQRAAELTMRPQSIRESSHPGPLPSTSAFILIDSASVVLQALKQAEDGQGTIMRCQEIHGRSVRVRIDLVAWGHSLHVDFGPLELKTWRITADGRLVECNLIEAAVSGWELAVEREKDSRSVSATAYPVEVEALSFGFRLFFIDFGQTHVSLASALPEALLEASRVLYTHLHSYKLQKRQAPPPSSVEGDTVHYVLPVTEEDGAAALLQG